MENNDLRDALRAAGLDLFQDRRSDSKSRAQDCLSGRTHYVDDATLRCFKSRILSSDAICSDTLFYIVESVSLDPNHTRRGVRGVVFDIFGTAVYRPSLDQCHKTTEQAKRAMWAWLDTFSEADHYVQKLETLADRKEREAREMREAVAKIKAAKQ
jgi:hypothetical protein